MLVITHVGTKAGEVVDLPPLSARAMLADGRASLPDTEAAPAVVVVVAEPDSHAPARVKRRRTR